MRIKDLLAKESIQLNGSAQDKKDVLNQMVDLMAKSGKISDVDTYRNSNYRSSNVSNRRVSPPL